MLATLLLAVASATASAQVSRWSPDLYVYALFGPASQLFSPDNGSDTRDASPTREFGLIGQWRPVGVHLLTVQNSGSRTSQADVFVGVPRVSGLLGRGNRSYADFADGRVFTYYRYGVRTRVEFFSVTSELTFAAFLRARDATGRTGDGGDFDANLTIPIFSPLFVTIDYRADAFETSTTSDPNAYTGFQDRRSSLRFGLRFQAARFGRGP
jgi:hypothetical protein